MAISVAEVRRHKFYNGYQAVVDITLDNAYPTGGYSMKPEDFGLNVIDMVVVSPANGFVFEFDHANDKLKAFYADYDAAADGALIELPDASSALDGVTVRAIAFGY